MSSETAVRSPTPRALTRPLVVELVGTPGAGKTTLGREVVRILRAEGVRATTVIDGAREHAARTLPGRVVRGIAPQRLRQPLLWETFYVLATLSAIGFSLDHARLAGGVLAAELGRPIPTSRKRHDLFWFFQLAGRTRLFSSTSRPGEALVLDDGFLHRSVQLHASHLDVPDGARVRTYVDRIPRPDLAIVVRTDRGLCERRVRERGVWRHSRHLTDEELSRYISNAERVVDVVAHRARERGWTLAEVQNGARDLDAVRSDLEDALRPLLPDPGSGGPPTSRAREPR